MEDTNTELEKFRTQWREEVSARAKGTIKTRDERQSRSSGPPRAPSKHATAPPLPPSATINSTGYDEDELDAIDPKAYRDLANSEDRKRLDSSQEDASNSDTHADPHSALEHYERAVEKESQGSLGDSLSLYRKAYRVCLHDSTFFLACLSEPLPSLIHGLIKRTKTNTSQPLRSPRNPPTQIHPTLLSQFQTLPITPYKVVRYRYQTL